MPTDKNAFTSEELSQIVEESKSKSPRDHLFFLLLSCVGMLIEECLTLKIEYVDFKNRVLKTRQNDINLIDYFFPNDLEPLLKSYIESIKGQTSWLFPDKSKKGPIQTKEMITHVKKQYDSKYAKFDRFRASLIAGFVSKSWVKQKTIDALFNFKGISKESVDLEKLRYYYDRAFPFYHLVL